METNTSRADNDDSTATLISQLKPSGAKAGTMAVPILPATLFSIWWAAACGGVRSAGASTRGTLSRTHSTAVVAKIMVPALRMNILAESQAWMTTCLAPGSR